MGSSNPGCLKFLKRFNKKNRSPEMINFFLYCIKKISFWGAPKGPPHDRCRRTMKKTILQWTPTESVGVPGKMDEYVHWGPIFYVCNSARNWVSSMYKGIDQFPLGSSDPGCLKFLNWRTLKKHQVTRNDKFICVLWKQMSFSSSPKVTSTTGVIEQWKKN